MDHHYLFLSVVWSFWGGKDQMTKRLYNYTSNLVLVQWMQVLLSVFRVF